VNIASVLAPLLHLQETSSRETKAVDDVSLGSAILIGIWIFFVTARPRRETTRSQTKSLPVCELGGSQPIEEWSFDPSKSDGTIIEQADGWVLR
jgi:hypothetical protein